MNYKPLSKEFLLAQGKCCKNSCAFCPYKKKNINMKTIVKQFEGKNGGVKNQFIITTPEGEFFQSYNYLIVKRDWEGKIYLDEKYYNYSVTTSKYRNQFLGMKNSKEVENKIKTGMYTLTNLN